VNGPGIASPSLGSPGARRGSGLRAEVPLDEDRARESRAMARSLLILEPHGESGSRRRVLATTSSTAPSRSWTVNMRAVVPAAPSTVCRRLRCLRWPSSKTASRKWGDRVGSRRRRPRQELPRPRAPTSEQTWSATVNRASLCARLLPALSNGVSSARPTSVVLTKARCAWTLIAAVHGSLLDEWESQPVSWAASRC